MLKRNQDNHENSCILVADVEDSSYSFNVAIPDIETGMKTIMETYEFLNCNCKRVYIAGFAITSKGTNLTTEGLIDRVIFSTEMMNKARIYGAAQAAK